MKENKNGIALDPRIGLALLLITNIVIFAQKTYMPGNAFVLMLFVFMLFCGFFKTAFKFGIFFLAMVGAQKFIFPIAPAWINILFGIFCNCTRRMFPCLMAGVLLIKTNTMHRFIIAMRKMHFPQKLIIPIAVSVRYFPAMKEEYQHIREAMKLRKMPWTQQVEGTLVPLILSATQTAEELAQAAVTRGIEDPAPKTSAEQLKCKWTDGLMVLTGLLLAIIVLYLDRM